MDDIDRPPAARLARAYAALLVGFRFPGSESDESRYLPFWVSFSADREVTDEALRDALKLAPWWKSRLDDGDVMLTQFIADARDPDYDLPPIVAQSYELLERAMHATLNGGLDAATFWAPSGMRFHKTRQLLFGRAPGDTLAGVMSYSVET
jgi:hypothetical protein